MPVKSQKVLDIQDKDILEPVKNFLWVDGCDLPPNGTCRVMSWGEIEDPSQFPDDLTATKRKEYDHIAGTWNDKTLKIDKPKVSINEAYRQTIEYLKNQELKEFEDFMLYIWW